MKFEQVFKKIVGLILSFGIFSATAFSADLVKTLERSFVKLAEGVYAIRHKDAPDTFPQGNTTVIIGEREVLVVDSCYLPSSAKENIAQINRIGAGQRNLELVREAVQKNLDVSSWRQKFAGNDKDNQDFFDTTYAGLITAAHAEIWGQ